MWSSCGATLAGFYVINFMELKQCSKCKEHKLLNYFPKKNTTRDGLHYYCKPCYNERNRKYYLSHRKEVKRIIRNYRDRRKTDLEIYVKLLYSNMVSRTKRNPEKYGMTILSRKRFYKLASNNIILTRLFKEWHKSGHERKLTPSVDRINNLKGYIEGNIQFLTLEQNYKKGFIEAFN